MTLHADSASVIRAANQALSYAERGWKDFLDRGDRGDAGLATAITTARSVTNVLQNLRSLEPEFDAWWREHIQVLDEPGARWVVDARNMIEKQGVVPNTQRSVHFPSLNGAQISAMLAAAPRGTTGMFFGDLYGRTGWYVQLDDGSTTQVFFSLPESIGSAWVTLPTVDGRRLDEVFPEYLATLRSLIDAAAAEFTGSQ